MSNYIPKQTGHFTVRTPESGDAEAIINFSKAMFASTDQTLTSLEEYTITTDGEIAWINNFNGNPNAIALVAEQNGQIAGLLFFVPNTKKKNAHTGEFGVSVHPDFQRQGIGRALVEALVEWAIANSSIEKLYLQVFATNTHAIKLYADLGFVEEGKFPRAIRQADGRYVDVIQMYRLVG